MLTVVIEDFLPDKYESYSNQNQMMSSQYMPYADDIDEWLKDRPRGMIKHCLLRKSLGEQLDSTGIKIIENGKFSIKYHKDGRDESNYEVNFGDDKHMPSCSCPDWKSSAYPCKHFFAVFKKFSCWGWESMSSLYRNSPFLNLDSEFLLTQRKESTKKENDLVNVKISSPADVVDAAKLLELPSRMVLKRKNVNGETIRSLLNEIRSLSFLTENNSTLTASIHAELTEIVRKMKDDVPKESGVPLLPKKQQKLDVKSYKKTSYKYMSLPKLKNKNLLLKRVGMKKEESVKASQLKIAVENVEKNEKIEVEQVIHDNNSYDEPSFHAPVIVVSDDEDDNATTEKNLENDVAPFARTVLSHNDLKDISGKRMLNDNVINVFQNIIKRKFPNVGGLQDTVLGQTLNFRIYRSMPFVQVLHDGNLHWITISTYGCKPGEVHMMDSMFRGKVSDHTKTQICSIINCCEDQLKVKVIPVQQQKNRVDCGVFAVAFAYHTVATKKLPTDINFETSKMRNHMLQCLAANQITKFPQCDSHIIARRCASKEISIDLYCSCRMPWRAAESYILDKQMAECSNCGGWFHRIV